MRFQLPRLASIILSFVIVMPALAQTTITLQEGLLGYIGTTDTKIESAGGGTNQYGANATYGLWSSNTAALVRFPIFVSEGGPVPNGATISSATLSMYKYFGPDSVFQAKRLLRSWQEMQANWNVPVTGTSWQTAGALGAADVLPTADGQGSIGTSAGWMSIDVTSGVQAFSGGTGNYGWRITWVSGTTDPKSFIARDHTSQPTLRPKLTITYTTTASCNFGALRPFDQAPIGGNAISIAATGSTDLEVEHFNCGGPEVAYHDNVPGNAGGQFRTGQDVDIFTSTDPAGGAYVVKNFETGEWLKYTINVAQAGYYDLAIRASNHATTATLHVDVNGVSSSVSVPNTGSWSTFEWHPASTTIYLPGGEHVLTLVMDAQYADVNQIRLTATATPPSCNTGNLRPFDQAPINGNPISVATTGNTDFEAEHFNCGGPQVAYHDNASGNAGAQYRPTEDVDIFSTNDTEGGAYEIQNSETGEWLTYTITIAEERDYQLAVRASNHASDAMLRFDLNGQGTNTSTSVTVPNTGSWNTFAWHTASAGVHLPVGQYTLTLFTEAQYANVNRIRVIATTTPPPPNPTGLLFRSGFEDASILQTPCVAPPDDPQSGGYGNGCWQHLAGPDPTGSEWPFRLLGGRTKFQLIADAPPPGGGAHTASTIDDFMSNSIRVGEGRNGSKALYQEIIQKGGPSTQDTFHLKDSNPPQLYISYWIKLPTELPEQLATGGNRVLFETKTFESLPQTPLDYNWLVEIILDAQGNPQWLVKARYYPGAQKYWQHPVPVSEVPVPIDTWFKVEVFFRRSSNSDARFWISISNPSWPANTQSRRLVDCPNPNIGAYGSPLNRIMITNLYSQQQAMPMRQWVDDLQIWDSFPPPAQGTEPWFDGLYARHDDVNSTNCVVE